MNHRHRADAYNRGVEYLRGMQNLLPDPAMVDVMGNLRDRSIICTFLGENIDAVNADLRRCLVACHDCFHPQQRRLIQIFAVPLTQSLGLDGLCHLSNSGSAILVDVGRLARKDWLRLVAHEYAHAYLNSPGHGQEFAAVLSHLCLGLGLEPPPNQINSILQSWPPYTPTLDALAFWRGEREFSSGCGQNHLRNHSWR